MKRFLIIFLGQLLLFIFVTTSFAESVKGKVTVGDEKTPVAGITISAYSIDSQHLTGEAPFASKVTKDDGLFSVELPPGSYFFIAEGEKLYCYYGRNPVSVPEGGLLAMNLSLIEKNPSLTEDIEPRVETGLFGQLLYRGKPLAGAIVTVYTDLNSQLKGMGLGMTAPTDENGIFEAEMPAGTYYLVARKRNSGGFMGPLKDGDYFGYYPANPLAIKEGELQKIAFEMLEVPEKVTTMADSLFGQTSIEGIIVDGEGKPREGMRALLYADPMMLNRPLYVSQPSGADGRFVLSFPYGGVFFLAARDVLGGPPVPGQHYGRYLGSKDGSVKVKSGEKLKDIELIVEEME